jgi:hypothetical protein
MNKGSNSVFIIAPAIIDIIENFGLPSALMIELNVIQSMKNGIQIAMILPYVIA